MKKILLILSSIFLLSLVSVAFTGTFVNAQNSCGGIETSIISCANDGGSTANVKDSAVWQILRVAINILTGGVMIAALGGLIYASVLYTSSGANPETRKKSMTIMTNIVIGIVTYALMWALLNFILPGGIGL